MTRCHRTVSALTFLLAVATTGAQATEFGHHPAVRTGVASTGIDANRFIVMPPASTTWTRPHANDEHPALAAVRQALQPGIDANAFLVQPPASVTWTNAPAEPAGTAGDVAVLRIR